MIPSIRSVFLIAFAGILICGCSGNSSQPISPDNPDSSTELTVREETDTDSADANHYLMQYGYIFVDPDHPDGPLFEVIPVRQGEIHLNILKLLEIAPCDDCFRVVGFDFPEPDKLTIDIQIDHPLDQLDYSVFDVRCIMMFNGSHEFPVCGKSTSDPALGDGAVLNPDGYTALYNGSTITAPIGDLQKYFQGKLATWMVPDSDINGYKYFITDNPSNNRNAFYAGSSDVQTFSLQLPADTFVIGYAVDANWWPPIESPVDDPLTDFDTNANCIEPWKVVVIEEPICDGLTEIGGQTKLIIEVYDWQGKSTHHAPVVECPEIFDGTITSTYTSPGIGFNRHKVTISNDKLAPVGTYTCLVKVEALENNPVEIPWLDLTAYQIVNVEVIEEIPAGPGHIIWAKRAGGAGCYDYDKGNGITTLSDDSTVATGWFSETATFGEDEPNETVLTSADGFEIFIARYNPDGTLIWAKRAGGNLSDYAYAITALSDNSTVVTGWFEKPATFGPGEPNETILTSPTHGSAFIARYNPDGTLQWAKRAGGSNSPWSNSITTVSDNSTIVTGYFYESATFGPDESNETILTSAGKSDIFIAHYNPDGTLLWVIRAGGPSKDEGYAVTSLTDDSTVVTGIFTSWAKFGLGEPNETLLLSNGQSDFFIAQYNPDGMLKWAKSAGGTSSNDEGHAITALSDDSTIVTGIFDNSVVFGAGEPNETTLTDAGQYDIFIARYNPDDGTLIWAKSAGEHQFENSYGITTLSDDSIVVSGDFKYLTTFGPGEPNETALKSAGNWDIFIARYNPDGTLLWAKHAGGSGGYNTGYECGHGITTLSDNSTVVTGCFYGSATFGECDPFETVLTSAGVRDIFIARYAE
jgi:uncharacterized delta-60 repeat protein